MRTPETTLIPYRYLPHVKNGDIDLHARVYLQTVQGKCREELSALEWTEGEWAKGQRRASHGAQGAELRSPAGLHLSWGTETLITTPALRAALPFQQKPLRGSQAPAVSLGRLPAVHLPEKAHCAEGDLTTGFAATTETSLVPTGRSEGRETQTC